MTSGAVSCYFRLAVAYTLSLVLPCTGRGSLEQGCASIRQPTLVVGVDSDVLYPLQEQEYLASLLPHSELAVIESRHGHDGFLLEQSQMVPLLHTFLDTYALPALLADDMRAVA